MGWFPLGRVPQKLRAFPGLRLVWNSLPFCDKLCAKHLGDTVETKESCTLGPLGRVYSFEVHDSTRPLQVTNENQDNSSV